MSGVISIDSHQRREYLALSSCLINWHIKVGSNSSRMGEEAIRRRSMTITYIWVVVVVEEEVVVRTYRCNNNSSSNSSSRFNSSRI
jgi:hypothetical protein